MQKTGALLTEQQKRILQWIREWAVEHDGATPSVRDISRCAGLSSTGPVGYELDRMAELGVIERTPERGTGRGIALRW
ncbi:hypothetical protein ACIQI8_27280 [Streptomyces sp. NPDC092369]|uniref:LexA family protein n=1 Tax=Streptomyces sp. NPDC092369 TaxID=3366015 RepID=UPI00380B6F0D